MTWLIIALVLVAAFGPVFWLRPSKRDKRLTALRERARQAGILVDIKPLTRLRVSAQERVSSGGKVRSNERLLARYGYTLDKPLKALGSWRVLRDDPTSDASEYERPSIALDAPWRYDPERDYPPTNGWPQSWEVLQPRPESLADSIRAVELEPRLIAVYWSETGDNVDEIAATLRTWAQQLGDLDLRERERAHDENS